MSRRSDRRLAVRERDLGQADFALPHQGRDTLGQRPTVHAFGAGEFPDGFAFDCDGVWVACVKANRVIRFETNGRRSLILDGSLPELIAEGEAFFAADQGGRHHVELGARSPLKNIASVAFGGADLKTVYLGNLAGDRIATFAHRAPAPNRCSGAFSQNTIL
jgi:sugar lactone lactonase YvrE